jgi:octaprenyl-diphosphate synthase
MSVSSNRQNVIQEVSEFLTDDLARVDEYIRSIIDSDTALVREVGEYVRSTRGKRLRPMLAMLTAHAFRYTGEDHIKVAAALELVHSATLLHDDVIDKAQLRRGKPTVNAQWGDDVAILIADYLFSHAFNLALSTSMGPQVLNLVCQVTARMCEGEMFQIEKRNALLTREDYLRIVRGKTAYLFSACTALGSMLARAPEQETMLLAAYGLNFGIAFQITDDLLDLVAPDEQTGKPRWADIRNGKQTLPLIYTFEKASDEDKQLLVKLWNNGRDPGQIMPLIEKYGGVDYALDEARKYAVAAQEQIADLPRTRPLELLRQIAEYVVNRSA